MGQSEPELQQPETERFPEALQTSATGRNFWAFAKMRRRAALLAFSHIVLLGVFGHGFLCSHNPVLFWHLICTESGTRVKQKHVKTKQTRLCKLLLILIIVAAKIL